MAAILGDISSSGTNFSKSSRSLIYFDLNNNSVIIKGKKSKIKKFK